MSDPLKLTYIKKMMALWMIALCALSVEHAFARPNVFKVGSTIMVAELELISPESLVTYSLLEKHIIKAIEQNKKVITLKANGDVSIYLSKDRESECRSYYGAVKLNNSATSATSEFSILLDKAFESNSKFYIVPYYRVIRCGETDGNVQIFSLWHMDKKHCGKMTINHQTHEIRLKALRDKKDDC